MKSAKSNLFVVSAPSGAGKTTLCRELVSATERLFYSVSYTSRAPRGKEENGKDYFFLSRSEFEAMVRDNRFAEWAEVYGNLYGTARHTIDESMAEGNDVLFDIDIKGARQIKQAYPHAALVFIVPPSIEELTRRLRKRGQDSVEVMQARVEKVKSELAESDLYDYVIINDRFEDALARLKAIVIAERSKKRHFRNRIESLLSEPEPDFA